MRDKPREGWGGQSPPLFPSLTYPHLYDNGAGASGVQCFAPPPRCQCRYRSVPKARTCSIEGLGQLRYPIPNLGNNHPPFVRQRSRCIWGAVLRTSPRCTTMRGNRSVPEAQTCSIEGLGQLRHPIPNLGNNHPPFVRQWSRCIWGAVLRTSPRCTTMRGLQVRARGTDL